MKATVFRLQALEYGKEREKAQKLGCKRLQLLSKGSEALWSGSVKPKIWVGWCPELH